MSIQSAGGLQPQNIQNAALEAKAQKTEAKVKNAAEGMKQVMSEIKELSQEMRNQQFQKLTGKEKDSNLETQTNKALDQLKEQSQVQQKQVQSQAQSQQAQLGGKDAEVVAAAMAGLMEEEELGELDSKQQALEEKMEILMEHAEGLQDVELSNPDDNYELQQMFSNIDKFKGLKRREDQLNKKLEDLEINLKQQDAREELNKLPVDSVTKKMRDQVLNAYDDNQKQQAQDQQSSQSDKNSEEDEENKENKKQGQ